MGKQASALMRAKGMSKADLLDYEYECRKKLAQYNVVDGKRKFFSVPEGTFFEGSDDVKFVTVQRGIRQQLCGFATANKLTILELFSSDRHCEKWIYERAMEFLLGYENDGKRRDLETFWMVSDK